LFGVLELCDAFDQSGVLIAGYTSGTAALIVIKPVRAS